MDFETVIRKAVDDKIVAGAALIAADKTSDGPVYTKCFGNTDIEPNSSSMQLDTMYWIASCSKLLTSIACLQCVEHGLLTLDGPISRQLPDFERPQILTGFSSSNEPQFADPTTTLTLRHLLTHSAGLTYDLMNPKMTQYRTIQKHRMSLTGPINAVKEDHLSLLSFNPGDGWEYGSSLDWAGKAVEAASGQSLGDFMHTSIWTPLGMKSTTFRPLHEPELMKRMNPRFMRGEGGKLVPAPDSVFPITEPEDDLGGSGLYSCASDYIKVLTSILHNDGKLLQPATVDELFRPQLSDTTHLHTAVTHPVFRPFLIPGAPDAVEWNHGLGGIIAASGAKGRWSKGTMMWSGLPNSYWWIDRTAGVCGFYGGQLFPPGDLETGQLNARFQEGIYAQFAQGG